VSPPFFIVFLINKVILQRQLAGSQPYANNESSEVFDIIKAGRRVEIKVTGSKISITFDDSLFASRTVA